MNEYLLDELDLVSLDSLSEVGDVVILFSEEEEHKLRQVVLFRDVHVRRDILEHTLLPVIVVATVVRVRLNMNLLLPTCS